MNAGDWLVRATAWCALIFYVSSEAFAQRGLPKARLRLTTLGCVALVIHTLFAFHYRYEWSHATAYNDTARQTGELTGWNWGGGIYINYLFILAWVIEVLRSWANRHRSAAVDSFTLFTRGLFLFMFVNASVIFVRTPWRWFGLACCLALLALWFWPLLKGQARTREC